MDAVPESAPRAGVPGGWGAGVPSSAPPQAAAAAPSLDGSAQMAAAGGGGLFDGGVGGSFLGRDIFAQHRVGGGGSIGFGLADMGAPTTGGSSGGARAARLHNPCSGVAASCATFPFIHWRRGLTGCGRRLLWM
jgi:hypothetical protein